MAHATSKTVKLNVNQRFPFIEKNPLMMGKYNRKTVEEQRNMTDDNINPLDLEMDI